MDSYDRGRTEELKKKALDCDWNNDIKAIVGKYGLTLKDLDRKDCESFVCASEQCIYLCTDNCEGKTYNTPIWNIKNQFEYVTMVLLHEIGHIHNGDTGRNITKDTDLSYGGDKWSRLKDEKEGKAWEYAFCFRKEHASQYSKLVKAFECQYFHGSFPNFGLKGKIYDRNDMLQAQLKQILGEEIFSRFEIYY